MLYRQWQLLGYKQAYDGFSGKGVYGKLWIMCCHAYHRERPNSAR